MDFADIAHAELIDEQGRQIGKSGSVSGGNQAEHGDEDVGIAAAEQGENNGGDGKRENDDVDVGAVAEFVGNRRKREASGAVENAHDGDGGSAECGAAYRVGERARNGIDHGLGDGT